MSINDHFHILRRQIKRRKTLTERMQLILSMSYAWGIPTLLTITCHMIDAIDGIPSYLKPGLGLDVCYLKGIPSTITTHILHIKISFYISDNSPISQLIYHHLPLVIIFTMNLVLFILTAIKIYSTKHGIKKRLSRAGCAESSGNHSDR